MNSIKFYRPISIQRTPCASDFVLKQSYAEWINGYYAFGPGADENKFFTIGQEYDTSDYLNLELTGAMANGNPVSFCNGVSSIQVDHTNLAVRDDGYGIWYVNYVDFINDIFNHLTLHTRLSSGDDAYFRTNYYRFDEFSLVFRETGQLNSSSISPYYFLLQSYNQYTLLDTFSRISDPAYEHLPVEYGSQPFIWA